MKKIKLSLLLFAISLTGALLLYPNNKNNQPSVLSAQAPAEIINVQQTIDNGTGNSSTNSLEVQIGSTVLEVLSSTADIITKDYSFGTAVEAINGIENGQNNKYWLYYVNGKEASIGAGEYKLSSNDHITWIYK